MIRLIATIDTLRGIVDEPSETVKAFQAKKTRTGKVVYVPNDEYTALGWSPESFAATNPSHELKWITGGSELFKDAILGADELFITQINGFSDAKDEFPAFCDTFFLFAKSKIHKENGTEFQHQIWKSKRYLTTVELEDA